MDGYRATGGIRHAVAQSAETLYDSMDHAQRRQLRSLLLRLVMPTEDGDPVRARVPRAKVAGDDAHRQLVERLVDARLVSVDGDTVQIAHEALVRVWPRLRGWLDDDVDGQRLFRHLAGAADAWDAMGRPDSELYRGARLSRVLEWRDRATPDLNACETDFLAASSALSESELRAAETRIVREQSGQPPAPGCSRGCGRAARPGPGGRRTCRAGGGPGGPGPRARRGLRPPGPWWRLSWRTPGGPARRRPCTTTSRPGCCSRSLPSTSRTAPRPGEPRVPC